MYRKTLLFTLFISITNFCFSQETTLFGEVNSKEGFELEGATVFIKEDLSYAVATNKKGRFELKVPSDSTFHLVCTFLGYDTLEYEVKTKKKRMMYDFTLTPISIAIGFDVVIQEERADNIVKLESKHVDVIAGPKQSVESLVKTLPGVTSNNELSSQYSVRGGNYDENLVYVNDFQIYRPQLIRSGQQEGLSFINSDMISSIYFSPGGFQANYGDKMSSVLDVKYKRPDKFGAKTNLGLLDQSIYLQGVAMDRRLRLQAAFRRQSNQYLLSGNDIKGEYRPRFLDLQLYSTYLINTDLELSVLFYASDNKYKMVPQSQKTRLGTVQSVKSFNVYFGGQEISQFQTLMGGVSLKYFDETSKTTIKWLTSAYRSNEDETFDIIGQYYLNEVDADLGSEEFAEDAGTIGVGTFHNWARNFLDITVANTELKGSHHIRKHNLLWSLKYQREMIQDEMLEWTRLDSANHSLPFSTEEVKLNSYIRSAFDMNSNRYSSYLQDNINWESKDSTNYNWSFGIRHQYWNFTDEHLVSPRSQFAMIPNWKKDIRLRTAVGVYYQPGFYREFRALDGSINKKIKAQRSFHFALGGDYNFKAWNRPFKFSSELYYKMMDRLIPYEVDNVKIRYYAENNAKGYATGLDLRLNGEFVEGAESWISLSFLNTKENINNDVKYTYLNEDGVFVGKNGAYTKVKYSDPGYIPRPTDQRVTFNLFFQDYLPNNDKIKMSLNLLFGSGYRFGPPDHERSKDTLKMPPYRRVDIGMSSVLLDGEKGKYNDTFWDGFESIWATIEVFNILAVKNTVSYFWIKDINNLQYPVPNYLTSRRVNFRLIVKF